MSSRDKGNSWQRIGVRFLYSVWRQGKVYWDRTERSKIMFAGLSLNDTLVGWHLVITPVNEKEGTESPGLKFLCGFYPWLNYSRMVVPFSPYSPQIPRTKIRTKSGTNSHTRVLSGPWSDPVSKDQEFSFLSKGPNRRTRNLLQECRGLYESKVTKENKGKLNKRNLEANNDIRL